MNLKISIRGDKIVVTKAIKDYLHEKLERLNKYFKNSEDIKCNVIIRVKNNLQTVEVSIPTSKFNIRCEEGSDNLYASIDMIIDKLERMIRKNKTRLKKKIGSKEDFITDFKVSRDEEEKGKIVKRKLVETKPMDCEEAILQMNLLGHDFYVFNNEKTSSVCVVYKRKDSNYGLIETK